MAESMGSIAMAVGACVLVAHRYRIVWIGGVHNPVHLSYRQPVRAVTGLIWCHVHEKYLINCKEDHNETN